ncbi:cytochrome C peroxidase [Seongchinamella sediminis]|uniref:Cytochrome C peroxidase n=1 Tax=Seongchinamella sediminis TaxID=2283635 RepID=A0A3L7DWS6_9GAMM|nr:cytochrome c peroxidase [Seongchinamella sediminis]RLQ21019.1 cytochrome C peroxidase [Seongchinamella sediminis]
MPRVILALCLVMGLFACKHPLEIKGQGSIVERIYGERGCSWEEFQAGDIRCTENNVKGERYLVSYEAIPEPGWKFSHWEGLPCAEDSVGDYCEFDVPKSGIDKAHAENPDGLEVAATIAVFVRDNTPEPEGLDLQVFRAVSADELDGDPRRGDEFSIRHPLAQLGKKLFFSKSLSADFDVACASCHHPTLAGGDKLSLPVGVEARKPNLLGPGRERRGGRPTVPRNSPSTFNAWVYQEALFWDGRVSQLSSGISTPDSEAPWKSDPLAGDDLIAAQSRFPVVAEEEMRGHDFLLGAETEAIRTRIAQRIGDYGPGAGEIENNRWLAEFRTAFNSKQSAEKLVTYDNIALALAAYQRSQVFVDTPWKAFLEGDYEAISNQAKRGALVFFQQKPIIGINATAACSDCHSGDRFTNEDFQASGFPQIGPGRGDKGGASGDDRGRGNLYSSDTQDYRFRVPSLLNVANTGPWGHAGAYGSLRRVVAHYDLLDERVDEYFASGGWCNLDQFKDMNNCAGLYTQAESNTAKAVAKTLKDNEVANGIPLIDFTEVEIDQMVAFLRTLTDPCIEKRSCLSLWIPSPREAPDGHQLNAVNKQGRKL